MAHGLLLALFFLPVSKYCGPYGSCLFYFLNSQDSSNGEAMASWGPLKKILEKHLVSLLKCLLGSCKLGGVDREGGGLHHSEAWRLEVESGIVGNRGCGGKEQTRLPRPVQSKCSTGKGVRCLLLGTSVVKGKFFCKIGEAHADYRKWE